MRTLRLARVAAEAEQLRIKRIIRKLAIRGVLGAVGAIFGLAALAWLHVLVWFALAHSLHPLLRSVVLVAIDVVLALVFVLLAMRSPPDAIEREALELRRQSVVQIRATMSTAALIATMARAAGRNRTLGRTLGAVAARMFRRA